MSATVLRGDARHLPLADASVDLVVTSPPYFALRSYTDNGEHYDGQVGSEPTPHEFLAALWEVTAECVRVLKPGGSIFVNLGDKYAGSGGHNNAGISDRSTLAGNGHTGGVGKACPQKIKATLRSAPDRYNQASDGIRPKSLMGLPWRYAIGCIDQLGLILRAEVVWCLSGGAKVYARTANGDRPVMLRDLARSYRPEAVKLWNGERWTQVLGWNRTPDDEGALEFELRTGERVGCTSGHRWPTGRGVIRADEMRVGDVIATTRLPAPDAPRTPALLPDDDIGWLVGLYIAEGSRSGTMVQFAGHTKETARHQRLARIAAALDGTSAVYQTSENGATFNLSGSAIVGVIDRYVSPGTAKTKRLKVHAWQRSDAFLGAVVAGYLEGDGHYDAKNDRWRIGFTANDEWAADLRTLAARLGSQLRLRRASFAGFGKTFPGWRGEWRWTPTLHHNVKPAGEVVAIRRSRARDFYDLGVAAEPHLFALASGVLTHNSKPNGLPESVTDRVRRSHEQWFHLVTEPRYYAAVDEVREPGAWTPSAGYNGHARSDRGGGPEHTFSSLGNPLGALPGSVQTVATEPLSVPAHLGDHFAAFPSWWPWWIIKCWSPPGICVECGEGRRPVVVGGRKGDGSKPEKAAQRVSSFRWAAWQEREPTQLTGYACACPTPAAPTVPAVILDPFGGTGTTALMADALGRHGITVDLSADYCALADWRIFESGQGARLLAKHEGRRPPVALPQRSHPTLWGDVLIADAKAEGLL